MDSLTNILVISEQDLGGNQFASRTHIIEFCRSMAKLANVTLVTYTDPETIKETLPDEMNFRAIQLHPVKFPLHNLSYLLSTIKIIFTLERLHRTIPMDYLYIRAIPFGFGPLWFARLNHIPTILEINGVWDEEQKLAFAHLPSIKRLLVDEISKVRNKTMDYVCKTADLLVAVTPNIATYIQSKCVPEGKIIVATNGVNTEHFYPRSASECRKLLELPSNDFIVGYVGSLSAWQGVEYLIEALDYVHACHDDKIKVLIVGDGPQRQVLEDMCEHRSINDSVLFMGPKPYNEIPCYMSACDILIAPKKPLASGYSPLKIYEYLACGRPVLASAVTGLEFITQYELGLSFEPGNVADLAGKLNMFLDMPPEIRNQMGQRARKHVVEHHSWDSVTHSILDKVIGYFAKGRAS